MRVRMKPTSSRSRATPPATTHHRANAFPVASAGVDAGAAEVGEEAGVATAEVVGVVGVSVVVAGVGSTGDGEVAVNENVPLTGWPSAEVARQTTAYRPAGEPGRRRWVTVLPARDGLPL